MKNTRLFAGKMCTSIILAISAIIRLKCKMIEIHNVNNVNNVNNENYVILHACIKCHNINQLHKKHKTTNQQDIICKDIRFEDCFTLKLDVC